MIEYMVERKVSGPKVEGEVEESTRRETRHATTGVVNQVIGNQFEMVYSIVVSFNTNVKFLKVT